MLQNKDLCVLLQSFALLNYIIIVNCVKQMFSPPYFRYISVLCEHQDLSILVCNRERPTLSTVLLIHFRMVATYICKTMLKLYFFLVSLQTAYTNSNTAKQAETIEQTISTTAIPYLPKSPQMKAFQHIMEYNGRQNICFIRKEQ